MDTRSAGSEKVTAMRCPACGQKKDFVLVFEAVWKCGSCLRIFMSDSQMPEEPMAISDGCENPSQDFASGLRSHGRSAILSEENFTSVEVKRLSHSHK